MDWLVLCKFVGFYVKRSSQSIYEGFRSVFIVGFSLMPLFIIDLHGGLLAPLEAPKMTRVPIDKEIMDVK